MSDSLDFIDSPVSLIGIELEVRQYNKITVCNSAFSRKTLKI